MSCEVFGSIGFRLIILFRSMLNRTKTNIYFQSLVNVKLLTWII